MSITRKKYKVGKRKPPSVNQGVPNTRTNQKERTNDSSDYTGGRVYS